MGYFDILVGVKCEVQFYCNIVEYLGYVSGIILFLLDIYQEFDVVEVVGLCIVQLVCGDCDLVSYYFQVQCFDDIYLEQILV